MQSVIEEELELKLAPEKTKITSFREGFDFLGFHFFFSGVRIKDKSVEKFKDKIRLLTIRSHNFDDEVIVNINRVIRGYANYFATDFSNVKHQSQVLDQFIRRRLRCMKKKRISLLDNIRLKNKFFTRKGLITLSSFILMG